VTVRPLIKMTGETGFNEVLFEDLHVPDDLRLDEVGKGWTVAMTTLLYERGAAESAGAGGGESPDGRIQALIDLAKKTRRGGRSAWDNAMIRDRVLKLLIRLEALKQLGRRARVEPLTDHPMRLPLQSKLLGTEIGQEIAATALEIEGMGSTLYLHDPHAPDGGRWPLGYMNSYGMTIAAGTSEIQRNILGERVLGMAKSK
jgi:alkylation response protein AidB-like acyl-CoA dehydrogenase